MRSFEFKELMFGLDILLSELWGWLIQNTQVNRFNSTLLILIGTIEKVKGSTTEAVDTH